MSETTTPTPPAPPAPAAVRPFPISALRSSIDSKLKGMAAHSVLIVVDTDIKEHANGAVMWKVDDRFSFVGWLEHDIPSKRTSGGFEVRLGV